MLYNSVTDILRVYPQKNNAWMALDSMFLAEASELGVPVGCSPYKRITDPWGRAFPLVEPKLNYVDGEIVSWTFVTTVDGQEVKCVVQND